jgi:alpha-beta hydrolase superfamily lysophospholipase
MDDHLNRHLEHLAAIHVGWFTPIGDWIGTPAVDRIQPARMAPRVHLPALVIHGDRDETIDPARGRALFSALGSANKQWISVPGAGHRDVFITDMPLFADMAAWMLDRLREVPDPGL